MKCQQVNCGDIFVAWVDIAPLYIIITRMANRGYGLGDGAGLDLTVWNYNEVGW
jgi:hypothetical protein